MTRYATRSATSFAVVAFLLAVGATGADAQQVRVGGQLNVADDFDLGLGPRIAFEVAEGFQGIGTFDIYFPDNDAVDYWEINGNVVYRIALEDTDQVVPYGGGGLAIGRISTDVGPGDDVSDTEVGFNFVGGVEFPLQSLAPFVELRVQAGGAEQFIATGGILVP